MEMKMKMRGRICKVESNQTNPNEMKDKIK